MPPNQYSHLKTFWKALAATLAVLAPGGAALVSLPETVEAFEGRYMFFLLGLAVVLTRVASNLWKTKDLEGSPIQLLAKALPGGHRATCDTRGATSTPALAAPLLLFLLLLAGCATSVTTRFSETIYDSDGNPSETTYEVKSKGDVDQTVHEFAYQYGGEENVIAVGQSAVGVTSPAQSDALKAFLSLPPELLRALISVKAPLKGGFD